MAGITDKSNAKIEKARDPKMHRTEKKKSWLQATAEKDKKILRKACSATVISVRLKRDCKKGMTSSLTCIEVARFPPENVWTSYSLQEQ